MKKELFDGCIGKINTIASNQVREKKIQKTVLDEQQKFVKKLKANIDKMLTKTEKDFLLIVTTTGPTVEACILKCFFPCFVEEEKLGIIFAECQFGIVAEKLFETGFSFHKDYRSKIEDAAESIGSKMGLSFEIRYQDMDGGFLFVTYKQGKITGL